jgi:hypothetical protein
MTAQELHDDCYAAMCECPQFRGWDDDECFSGYTHTFGDTPKQGMYKTIMFWREWGDLLWNKGYSDALSPNTLAVFDNIDKVIANAIKNYCKTL